MNIPRFEVGQNTDNGKFYISMCTSDEAGTTRRDTVLDGFVVESAASTVAIELTIATLTLGHQFARLSQSHLTRDTLNIPFRF